MKALWIVFIILSMQTMTNAETEVQKYVDDEGVIHVGGRSSRATEEAKTVHDTPRRNEDVLKLIKVRVIQIERMDFLPDRPEYFGSQSPKKGVFLAVLIEIV